MNFENIGKNETRSQTSKKNKSNTGQLEDDPEKSTAVFGLNDQIFFKRKKINSHKTF